MVGGGGGGVVVKDSSVKRSRMLVISLMVANHVVWSHLGCSGPNASTLFSRQKTKKSLLMSRLACFRV